jgi:HSP20 family molecular chaperone IbpA
MAILMARAVDPFVAGIPWAPPADVTGTDDAYVVHVELPGVSYLSGEVKAEAMSAELSDRVLTVNMPKSEAAKPRKFEITG